MFEFYCIHTIDYMCYKFDDYDKFVFNCFLNWHIISWVDVFVKTPTGDEVRYFTPKEMEKFVDDVRRLREKYEKH